MAIDNGKMRDLAFAFNDKDFSDRVLHVEIVTDSLDLKPDFHGSDLVCATKPKKKNLNKKRKKGNLNEKGDAAYDNKSKCSTIAKHRTLYINSAILASGSPFFYKLFKNGMKESQQRAVILRISNSEELAVMDLLNFMYSNTLKATSAPDLLAVLMAADKFEVSSCMSHCSKMLEKMPMSVKSALLYLDLPSSESVKSLIVAARGYIAERFRDICISTSQEVDSMSLPLSAIEAILCNRSLQVRSEEDVYHFILKWGRACYPVLKERRKILTDLLARFLYFPYLCMSTLREMQVCPDFNSKKVSKLVLESLYLNAGIPNGQSNRQAATGYQFINRVYKHLPIKVMQLESLDRFVAYFYLTKEECIDLFITREARYSQPFSLGKESFSLYVEVEVQPYDEGFLGVCLQTGKSNGPCTLEFELSVMEEGFTKFGRVSEIEKCTLEGGETIGFGDVFGIPWLDFMADDCEYFMDGILRFQAAFTIFNSEA